MVEYRTELTDTTTEINKRIDDAFESLNEHQNLISSLIRDYRKLKEDELAKLKEKQEACLLWARILTGISAAVWIIQLILLFI